MDLIRTFSGTDFSLSEARLIAMAGEGTPEGQNVEKQKQAAKDVPKENMLNPENKERMADELGKQAEKRMNDTAEIKRATQLKNAEQASIDKVRNDPHIPKELVQDFIQKRIESFKGSGYRMSTAGDEVHIRPRIEKPTQDPRLPQLIQRVNTLNAMITKAEAQFRDINRAVGGRRIPYLTPAARVKAQGEFMRAGENRQAILAMELERDQLERQIAAIRSVPYSPAPYEEPQGLVSTVHPGPNYQRNVVDPGANRVGLMANIEKAYESLFNNLSEKEMAAAEKLMPKLMELWTKDKGSFSKLYTPEFTLKDPKVARKEAEAMPDGTPEKEQALAVAEFLEKLPADEAGILQKMVDTGVEVAANALRRPSLEPEAPEEVKRQVDKLIDEYGKANTDEKRMRAEGQIRMKGVDFDNIDFAKKEWTMLPEGADKSFSVFMGAVLVLMSYVNSSKEILKKDKNEKPVSELTEAERKKEAEGLKKGIETSKKYEEEMKNEIAEIKKKGEIGSDDESRIKELETKIKETEERRGRAEKRVNELEKKEDDTKATPPKETGQHEELKKNEGVEDRTATVKERMRALEQEHSENQTAYTKKAKAIIEKLSILNKGPIKDIAEYRKSVATVQEEARVLEEENTKNQTKLKEKIRAIKAEMLKLEQESEQKKPKDDAEKSRMA